MTNRIEALLKEFTGDGLMKINNDLCVNIYEVLSNALAKNKNEVSIVTDLCSVIDKKSYRNFSFHARKIHGKASNVE